MTYQSFTNVAVKVERLLNVYGCEATFFMYNIESNLVLITDGGTFISIYVNKHNVFAAALFNVAQ